MPSTVHFTEQSYHTELLSDQRGKAHGQTGRGYGELLITDQALGTLIQGLLLRSSFGSGREFLDSSLADNELWAVPVLSSARDAREGSTVLAGAPEELQGPSVCPVLATSSVQLCHCSLCTSPAKTLRRGCCYSLQI